MGTKVAAAAVAEPKATKAKKEKVEKVPGIGAFIREQILKGLPNGEVLKLAKEKFPESKMTSGGVGWYRNKLQAAGKKVPNSRDIVAKAKKADEKVKKAAAKAAPANDGLE